MAVSRLDQRLVLINEKGEPTVEFHKLWELLARAVEDLQDRVEALEEA